MKKFITILIIVVISLPFIIAHFLKSPSEEKKEVVIVENINKDSSGDDDSWKNGVIPNSNKKYNLVESEPRKPDPFENVRMNNDFTAEEIKRLKNLSLEPSPFDKEPEPIPVLDYKPEKNGEYLYERLNYGEEIDVQLPPKVGEKAPIKLKFEPNPANMDSIESFKITSLDGHVLEFDTFDSKSVESEKKGLYVFKDLKSKGHNSVMIIYDASSVNKKVMGITVDHFKTGVFRAKINIRTKKGYIYKYKPVPSGTKYGRDFVIPEDFNN